MMRACQMLMAATVAAICAAAPVGATEPKFPVDVLWVAERLGPQPFASVSRPTLQVAANGRASGTTGCNRYVATATTSGAALTFGAMGMTKMACFGAGSDNERLFAPALAAATGWRLEGRALVVETPGGPLRFRRR